MILDRFAELVHRFLAMISEGVAQWLFVPVFVITVMVAFVLVVHKLAGPFTRMVTTVLTWVITGASAFLLLGEMVVADVYRRRGARPPSAVYNLGDMVASWAVGLTAGAGQALTSVGGFLTRSRTWVLVLVCGAWLLLWNHQHCPDGATGCTRPLSGWTEQITSERG